MEKLQFSDFLVFFMNFLPLDGVSATTIHNTGFKIKTFKQSPYSSDVPFSHYSLFPKFKCILRKTIIQIMKSYEANNYVNDVRYITFLCTWTSVC